MRGTKFFGVFLIVCLCVLVVSIAHSKRPDKPPKPEPSPRVHYHGYAKLYDRDTSGRECVIVADLRDASGEPVQYVDRELTKGGKKHRRGDKIQVTYYTDTETLTYFRCFMGKPELPWRSDRRVFFEFDIANGDTGADYQANKTVADMLTFNVVGFPNDRRGNLTGGSYYLTDNSVHLTVLKGWGGDVSKSRAAFLVDKTDIAEDPNAITQTNLEELNPSSPKYWTAMQGSALGGGEEDPHDQIAFMLYDDNQLNFTPIAWEDGIPITWLVEPDPVAVNLQVWRYYDNSDSYYTQVLRAFNSPGLPFSLVVSKYPIGSDPRMLPSPAPPKYSSLTAT